MGFTLAACPTPSRAPDAALTVARAGLKVPLPDGWKATVGPTGSLQVGPAGKTVLELESSSRPLPALAALEEAVASQDVGVLATEEAAGWVFVRYAVHADGGGAEAFLGVRQVGRRTVWCASVAGAEAEEVTQAAQVCERMGGEAADAG
jgi:hypothetical protein